MKEEFSKSKSVVVYIDGACTGNPGPAAGAAIFFRPSQNADIVGADLGTMQTKDLKFIC